MIERLAFGRTGHASSRLIFGAAALGGMKQESSATRQARDAGPRRRAQLAPDGVQPQDARFAPRPNSWKVGIDVDRVLERNEHERS